MSASPEHSITVLDRPRAREEAGAVPVLLAVGDADSIAPAAERVVPFETALQIGRRAPPAAPADQAWVVRDHLVSSQHCLIEKEGDAFKLHDLGSRNGTVVDGHLVKATTPVKLRDGAVIFFGTQVAVFRIVELQELAAIREELASPFGPVATTSPAGASICRTLRKLAPSQTEILLVGETGVGKEVYARAVHDASGRPGPFVPINCAALPRELAESELFGYVRGAHSQARDSKRGLIEEAEGGTLFLDEIGEMAPELQTKLLRFLQDLEMTPLGATRGRRMDVRILAATSRTSAPSGAANVGLRADLAARLGAEPIRLPPLRQRLEDLGALAAHFLRGHTARFELQAFQALALHSWPGNVRELQKVAETAALLARGSGAIALEHLPVAISAGSKSVRSTPGGLTGRPPPPSGQQLEELLRRCQGNVQRVARELGRTPPLIYRWCKRYKLDPDTFRPKD